MTLSTSSNGKRGGPLVGLADPLRCNCVHIVKRRFYPYEFVFARRIPNCRGCDLDRHALLHTIHGPGCGWIDRRRISKADEVSAGFIVTDV
mmetsp:Transcript_40352/g.40993  ORF Transcript_40352/g.40993 Transcript_40352/m.40993 type:complete len:91 (-) Transcript_40352:424-696(-)